MPKILAMHQPNFLPWIGYFHKMALADYFVIMDTAQVPMGGSDAYRTNIKTPKGEERLSIQLSRDSTHSYQTQPLNAPQGWATMKTIRQNYSRAPFYDYNDFTDVFFDAAHQSLSLAEFNMQLIVWAVRVLNINTILVCQSMLGLQAHKEELPIRLCERLNCDSYLSGTGAKAYNDPAKFEKAGVNLWYQAFECPKYEQLYGEYIPNLSIIDLIFNLGPAAGEIL